MGCLPPEKKYFCSQDKIFKFASVALLMSSQAAVRQMLLGLCMYEVYQAPTHACRRGRNFSPSFCRIAATKAHQESPEV